MSRVFTLVEFAAHLKTVERDMLSQFAALEQRRERRGRRLICRSDRSLKGRQHKRGAEER
jgi:hypothetical protein